MFAIAMMVGMLVEHITKRGLPGYYIFPVMFAFVTDALFFSWLLS